MRGTLSRLLGPASSSINQENITNLLGVCKKGDSGLTNMGGALANIAKTPAGVAAILSATVDGESAILILLRACIKNRFAAGPGSALANIAHTPEGLEAIAACLGVEIDGRSVLSILNAVIKDMTADYAKASVLGILAKKVPGVRERLAKEPGGSPKLGIDAIAHPVAASTALGASAPRVPASTALVWSNPPPGKGWPIDDRAYQEGWPIDDSSY